MHLVKNSDTDSTSEKGQGYSAVQGVTFFRHLCSQKSQNEISKINLDSLYQLCILEPTKMCSSAPKQPLKVSKIIEIDIRKQVLIREINMQDAKCS